MSAIYAMETNNPGFSRTKTVYGRRQLVGYRRPGDKKAILKDLTRPYCFTESHLVTLVLVPAEKTATADHREKC